MLSPVKIDQNLTHKALVMVTSVECKLKHKSYVRKRVEADLQQITMATTLFMRLAPSHSFDSQGI